MVVGELACGRAHAEVRRLGPLLAEAGGELGHRAVDKGAVVPRVNGHRDLGRGIRERRRREINTKHE
jgi:hypothetical protein